MARIAFIRNNIVEQVSEGELTLAMQLLPGFDHYVETEVGNVGWLYNPTTGEFTNPNTPVEPEPTEYDPLGRWASIDTGWVPNVDGILSLGRPPERVAQLYAAACPITGSDAREKDNIRPLTANEIAAAVELSREGSIFQWLAAIQLKGVGDARLHCGLTVQRVIDVLNDHQLDPMRYGFICYDSWPEVEGVRPAGDRYSLRSTQLAHFIARGLSERIRLLEVAPVPVRFARNLNSGSNGQVTVNLPAAGMVLSVTPRTPGCIVDSVVQSVTPQGQAQAVVTFRKLKTGLITLSLSVLSLSLFEPTVGVVNFDITGEAPTP